MAASRVFAFAPFVTLASLACFTIGCQGADLSKASRTQLTSAQLGAATPVQAQPAPAPVEAQPASVQAQAAPVQVAPPSAGPSTSMPMFEQPSYPATPLGEQVLDTNVGPQQPPAGPVLTANHLKRSKVRTVSDENLPKWVPVRGRLTVVDSSDLAENLGLVPKGTTKKSDERISVADKLDEEYAARAAARATDPMTQGTSWSYAKAGKFRSRR